MLNKQIKHQYYTNQGTTQTRSNRHNNCNTIAFHAPFTMSKHTLYRKSALSNLANSLMIELIKYTMQYTGKEKLNHSWKANNLIQPLRNKTRSVKTMRKIQKS